MKLFWVQAIIPGCRETRLLTMMVKDVLVARLVAHAILLGQSLRSRLSKRLFCLAIDNPCSGRTREVTEDCHVSAFLLKEFRHDYDGRSKSGTKKARRDDLFRGSKPSHPEINISSLLRCSSFSSHLLYTYTKIAGARR